MNRDTIEKTGCEAISGYFPHLPVTHYPRLVPPIAKDEPLHRTRCIDARTIEREAKLIGHRFGVLTIIKLMDTRNKNRWICKCQCGNPETRPKRLEDLFANPASCGFTCPLYRQNAQNKVWLNSARFQK